MAKIALKERVSHICNAIDLIERFVKGINEVALLEDVKL